MYEAMVTHVAGFFDGNLALRIARHPSQQGASPSSSSSSSLPSSQAGGSMAHGAGRRGSAASEAASEYRNLDLRRASISDGDDNGDGEDGAFNADDDESGDDERSRHLRDHLSASGGDGDTGGEVLRGEKVRDRESSAEAGASRGSSTVSFSASFRGTSYASAVGDDGEGGL